MVHFDSWAFREHEESVAIRCPDGGAQLAEPRYARSLIRVSCAGYPTPKLSIPLQHHDAVAVRIPCSGVSPEIEEFGGFLGDFRLELQELLFQRERIAADELVGAGK